MPKGYPKLPSGYTANYDSHYIMDLRNGVIFDFPFPPIAYNERANTPAYASDTIVGRSSQFVNYTSSDNRSLSFDVTIIDDYVDKPLTEVRDILASMEMPNYISYAIIPPNVQVRLGKNVIRGVVSSVTFAWSGVYRNGTPTILTASFEIREARSIPLGSEQVRKGGWSNG